MEFFEICIPIWSNNLARDGYLHINVKLKYLPSDYVFDLCIKQTRKQEELIEKIMGVTKKGLKIVVEKKEHTDETGGKCMV